MSPSAEDVLEDEVLDRLRSLGRSSSSFRPRTCRTTGVENVSVGADSRHKERVHVNSLEEGRNSRDDRRDVKVVRLPGLAFMTRLDIPADVLS